MITRETILGDLRRHLENDSTEGVYLTRHEASALTHLLIGGASSGKEALALASAEAALQAALQAARNAEEDVAALRKERVELQKENDSLRLDLQNAQLEIATLKSGGEAREAAEGFGPERVGHPAVLKPGAVSIYGTRLDDTLENPPAERRVWYVDGWRRRAEDGAVEIRVAKQKGTHTGFWVCADQVDEAPTRAAGALRYRVGDWVRLPRSATPLYVCKMALNTRSQQFEYGLKSGPDAPSEITMWVPEERIEGHSLPPLK